MLRRAFLGLMFAGLAACKPKAPAAAPAAPPQAAKAFLAANARAPGVHVTRSGLQYRIIRSGPSTGLKPKFNDEVKLHYEGKFLSGEVFDSSYEQGAPVVWTLRPKMLIPGFTEALTLMRPGDEWQVYIPGNLGYGPEGKGPIPPDATLVFRIELIDVLPAEGSTGRA